MSAETRYLSLISGQSNGLWAAVARTGLSALEPAYKVLVNTRNRLFDSNLKSAVTLPRTTVSIGNITTGGTGKTPVVQWLARKWIAQGGHPAVLTRGYRSKNGISDEAEVLRLDDIPVQVNLDRQAGAIEILRSAPQINLFILDDGFQHRRVRRNLDIVLIDATNPFGHRHLLPRGLLREPLSSLNRAQAILITRADSATDLDGLKAEIRKHAKSADLFCSRHVFAGLVDAKNQTFATERAGRCLAMAGIGNAPAFFQSLRDRNFNLVETLSPGDHHVYTDSDLMRIRQIKGIDSIITTEKDWVKLRQLTGASDLPILRAQLRIDFADGDEQALFDKIVHTSDSARKQETG